jgi:hypothetical protein
VGDRKVQEMMEVFRGQEAQVGDQVNREAQANAVLGNGQGVRVEERFPHEGEVYPLAKVLLGNLIQKTPGQGLVHLTVMAGHPGIRTEFTVEIALVCEFEKDAFERFRSRRHGLVLVWSCWRRPCEGTMRVCRVSRRWSIGGTS